MVKIIATTRCYLLKLKCTKFDFGCGSAPDTAEEAHSAPQAPWLDSRRPTSKGKGRKKEKGERNK